jgi:ribulose-phosphate 3-epimerase
MRKPVRIAPSILSADFAALGREVTAVTDAGADLIHVDVMDGHFVPNLTIGPVVLKAIKACTALPFDVHLMISPVDAYIPAFVEAGAANLSVHPEAGPHLHRTIQLIHSLGCSAGVVLNPSTPLEAIDWVLGDVERVLVMSVNPGYGGQKFLHGQLDKIRALRARIDATGRDVDLEVDGGINPETARACIAAGADMLVAGTAVFSGGAQNYAANIRALRGPTI